MVAPSTCTPCNCISGNINAQAYYQMSLVVLCDMLVAIEAGGGGGGGGGLPVPGAGSTVINEDSPSTDLEVISKIGAVRQDVLSSSTSAVGDWGWNKQDALGRLWTTGTYLEDAASASGDEGQVNLFRRTDVVATQTSTNGDYEVPQMYDGRVVVSDRDRVVTGNLDMTNLASTVSIVTDGMATVTLSGLRTAETGQYEFQVSMDGVTWQRLQQLRYLASSGAPLYFNNDSNAVPTAANINGKLYTVNVSGWRNFRIKTSVVGAGAALPITIVASPRASNTLDEVWPGTLPWCLGKAEDAAHASGDVGVMSLGVAATTPASAAASGDYTFLATNVMGTQYTEPANQVATYAAAAFAGTAGAVPTTGVSVLTNSAKAKIVTLGNTLDVAVLISLDAGTTYPFYVPATTGTAVLDLGSNGRWTASNIFAKAIGSNSASGTLYVGVTI